MVAADPLEERRRVLDWVIRPALRALPGVADVNSLGGHVRSFEVERVLDVGVPALEGNLDHFVVGRVVVADPHPNADRLRLCRVTVGAGEEAYVEPVIEELARSLAALFALGVAGVVLIGHLLRRILELYAARARSLGVGDEEARAAMERARNARKNLVLRR